MAVRNKASGFYSNHHVGSDWFNNTAYRNGANFNMLCRLSDNHTDVPGYGHKLRNNLGYKGARELVQLDPAKSDAANNSFDLELKITDKDFLSLDESQLVQPRQPNGDLPVMTFLHLADGSNLIDQGIPTGFPFRGARPDMGAFEK